MVSIKPGAGHAVLAGPVHGGVSAFNSEQLAQLQDPITWLDYRLAGNPGFALR